MGSNTNRRSQCVVGLDKMCNCSSRGEIIKRTTMNVPPQGAVFGLGFIDSEECIVLFLVQEGCIELSNESNTIRLLSAYQKVPVLNICLAQIGRQV
jgi:hypothetical protein